MQPVLIFSHLSSNAIAPSVAAPSCRSETQYGNEVRYLRKMIHASLSSLEQAGGSEPAKRDERFDGIELA